MKWWWIGGVLGLAVLPASAAEQGKSPDKAANWLTDYAEAKAAARKAGKPIFVVFR